MKCWKVASVLSLLAACCHAQPQSECSGACEDSETAESTLLQVNSDKFIPNVFGHIKRGAEHVGNKVTGAGRSVARSVSDTGDAVFRTARSVTGKVTGMSDEQKRAAGQYFLEMDGHTRVPVPRREVKGFVREVLFKYPLKSNPITVTGSTARIQLGKPLESMFSRDAHEPPRDGHIYDTRLFRPEEQMDFGVEIAVAFVGRKSMVSDKVKLAFAEKSHTLWMPDEVSRASENRMKKDMAKQSWLKRKLARSKRTARNMAIAAFASSAGKQIVTAGKDATHVATLRNLSKAGGGKPEASFSQAMEHMNKQLQKRKSLSTRRTPIRSSIGCLHFEGDELMSFADGSVGVPLDTKIVGYRGRLASTPNKEYQMSSGIAIFRHNAETDSLDLYFGFSSVVDLADSADGYGSVFDVGPADGASMPVVPEGRSATVPVPASALVAWSTAQSMYRDFSFMHANRKDVGCPDSVLNGLAEGVKKIQAAMQAVLDEKEVDLGDGVDQVTTVKGMMDTLIDEINCAVEFVKPWSKKEVVSMERLEVVGLLHVLMEMPGNIMQAAFKSSKMWNTITVL